MLTKSNYLKYLQCQKYLWLSVRRKDLIVEEDDNLKRLFEAGYEVEELAYKLYPNGVNVQDEDFKKARAKTRELMDKRAPVIFQATLGSKDLMCRSDIIRYNHELAAWDIIEVKSSTEKKKEHIEDLSFQKICFEEAGCRVGHIFLNYINKKFIKQGKIDPADFFIIEEGITEEVLLREPETGEEIKKALAVLKIRQEPKIEILNQCNKNKRVCPFIAHCWQGLPDYSIYSIASTLGKKKMTGLIDEGVLEVKDIPPKYLTSNKLKKHHKTVSSKKAHIEQDNIKAELLKIKYPIYFLDYETYSPAIPLLDGYAPYQRIVFQYSLHILKSEKAKLEHYYYLARDLKDPSQEMAESLKKLIGKKGSVIAWNMSFEKGCNKEMAERAPKYADFFYDVNERMYDLMHVFKEGYYVHHDFHASASLKSVLPVLVPDLSYKNLGIQEGGTASNSWGDMVAKKLSQKEKKEIFDNLLDYCELDTLAMVRILEKLRGMV